MTKNKNQRSGSWNFGPKRTNNMKVKKIISNLNSSFNNSVKIIYKKNIKKNYKESETLKLCSKKSIKNLNWTSKYNIKKTIKLISDWNREMISNKSKILDITKKQIIDYIN